MEPWLIVVLLGLVLVVYAGLAPRRERSSNKTNVIKEIEDTMEQFSAELEEENRQLLEKVAEMKRDHESHTSKLQGRIEALEQQNRAVGDQVALLVRAEKERVLRMEPAVSEAEAYRPKTAVLANNAPLRSEASLAEDDARRMNAPTLAPAPPPSSERGRVHIRERYAAVFSLYDQGKSTEYIAKKLEMNKGEVMLIIQLAKQEAQARV